MHEANRRPARPGPQRRSGIQPRLCREKVEIAAVTSAACGPVSAAVGAPAGADVGYIRISTFNRRTAELFEEALRALRAGGASAVVLDLRNNGGGYFPAGVQVAAPSPPLPRRRSCWICGDSLRLVGASVGAVGSPVMHAVQAVHASCAMCCCETVVLLAAGRMY